MRQDRLTHMEETVITPGVANANPTVGLRAVASLRLLVERLETLHVDRARDLGWSWAQIATELGVSKQAAHQKHGAGRAEPTRESTSDV